MSTTHSINFVDRVSGAHTQTVESLWSHAKQGNKARRGTHRSKVDSYLCEFVWRRRLSRDEHPFTRILCAIAELYPPQINHPRLVHPKEQKPVIVIPYYTGIGEHIKRLGITLNFRVFFKSSASLRNILRHDKISVPYDQRPGVVYRITCGCAASYIGETGNTLLDRFKEHQSGVTRYKNALERLNGTTQQRRRGRPQTKDPQKIMEDTIKGSAVVEHSSQCSHDLQANIICRESLFHVRKIKEALFIRHNPCPINRDRGVEVSEVWTDLINQTGCCTIAT
uniref:GIY-YIG domain-containing protein n=1 Tax=Trichuris muris TaxID=70415 RepID=A0A5S6QZR0_TRIMR